MINKVTLIGNLGKDPEVRRLESGAVVAKFSVATNEKYKDRDGNMQQQTEWHDVVVWRGLAEVAEKYFKKGMLVYVDGKLTHRKWEDKDGNTRYNTEVVGNQVRIMERKGDSSYNSGGSFPTDKDAPPAYNKSSNSAPNADVNSTKEPAPVSGDGGADDLPF